MTVYRRNPSFEREMRATAGLQALLRAQVEAQVKPAVETLARQAHAPWMPKGTSEPVVVEQDGDEVTVGLTGYGAHLIEFGSKNNPAHAPLRRGARAAGLRLDE